MRRKGLPGFSISSGRWSFHREGQANHLEASPAKATRNVAAAGLDGQAWSSLGCNISNSKLGTWKLDTTNFHQTSQVFFMEISLSSHRWHGFFWLKAWLSPCFRTAVESLDSSNAVSGFFEAQSANRFFI